MKFVYEYRTSDNVLHRAELTAANREAVFAQLKERGIRPGYVAEAPGFFNKLFGKGKRWLAIGFLAVLVIGSAFVIHSNKRTIQTIRKSQDIFTSTVRRQLLGDAAFVEKGVRDCWDDVFADDAERFFAAYALPGVIVESVPEVAEANLVAALSRSVAPTEGDSIEVVQLKSIVEGVKCEMREYIAAGEPAADYLRQLKERQEEEAGYYAQAGDELRIASESSMSREAVERLWEERNVNLRKMGIRTLPMPDLNNFRKK